jgi:hypothetical protein
VRGRRRCRSKPSRTTHGLGSCGRRRAAVTQAPTASSNSASCGGVRVPRAMAPQANRVCASGCRELCCAQDRWVLGRVDAVRTASRCARRSQSSPASSSRRCTRGATRTRGCPAPRPVSRRHTVPSSVSSSSAARRGAGFLWRPRIMRMRRLVVGCGAAGVVPGTAEATRDGMVRRAGSRLRVAGSGGVGQSMSVAASLA